MAEIIECDKAVRIQLLALRKTYFLHSLSGPPEMLQVRRLQRMTGPSAPVVTVTTDSEDTGERRQMGPYQAQHIKTTVTVKPSKGAQTHAAKIRVDGWYIDLPGLYCWNIDEAQLPPASWHAPVAPGTHDKFVFSKKGKVTTGYAIDEVSKEKSEGNVVINKIELLEFSEEPLDPSLFEVPPDYAQRVSNPLPRIEPGPATPSRPPQ